MWLLRINYPSISSKPVELFVHHHGPSAWATPPEWGGKPTTKPCYIHITFDFKVLKFCIFSLNCQQFLADLANMQSWFGIVLVTTSHCRCAFVQYSWSHGWCQWLHMWYMYAHTLLNMPIKYILYTLVHEDYDSFAMAILSQNHREFDIAESILVSVKVIITCSKGFSQ